MSWFGPQDCNCGCEDPPPPPPPECACNASPCFPTGKRQFSSIKVVIELTDSITISQYNQYRWCSGVCTNVIQDETRVTTVSGLSQFNGTYDIPYYTLSGSTYVLSNPNDNPCGYWWFPRITKAITGQVQRDVNRYGCAGNTQQITNISGNVNLQLHRFTFSDSNNIFTSIVYGIVPFALAYGTLSSETFPQSSTRKYFECQNPGTPDWVQNYNRVLTDPASNYWTLSSLQGEGAGTNPPPIGFTSPGTESSFTSGISSPGFLVTNHKIGGIDCSLSAQSREFHIPALSKSWTNPSPPANCGLQTTPQSLAASIGWGALTFKHQMLLNV